MSKNKTKITGLIACIAILIITVPVGFLTDVFDFEDLKTVGIEFSTILKVIVMAAAVIAVVSLITMLLSLPNPKNHRTRSLLSIVSSMLKYIAGHFSRRMHTSKHIPQCKSSF